MRRLLSMVRKDLLRQIRSPMGILVALSFPLVFASLLALTFGTGSGSRAPRVPLLVEDRDDSWLSGALLSVANSEQMAEYFDVRQVGPEGLGMIERDEASALWRIPENFQQDLIDGDPVEFELVRNPAQGILPEVAEQGLAVLTDVLSAAARVLRGPMDDLGPMLGGDAAPSAAQVASLSVELYAAVNRAEPLVNPPVIALEAVQLTDEEGEGGASGGQTTSLIFLVVLPGISVWGLFLVGDMAMRDILTESTQGTLRRQLAGPTSAGQLVLGKALFTATLSLVSLVLLAAIGWIVGGRGADPIGFLAVSLALVLAITGYASVVYGAASTERQGGTISGVLLLVFAFLGGSFVQLDILPAAVRRVSPLSPFYWGTTGYQKLIRDDGGLLEVLPNVGVLAALGVALLFAGSLLLRRRLLRGVA